VENKSHDQPEKANHNQENWSKGASRWRNNGSSDLERQEEKKTMNSLMHSLLQTTTTKLSMASQPLTLLNSKLALPVEK
jgi:hypothetical protein